MDRFTGGCLCGFPESAARVEPRSRARERAR
jgi:hypothetical protein